METEEKTEKRDKKDNLILFEKGVSGNPNGRPKGQRNYITIYTAALKKLAEEKGMTPEEFEDELEKQGLNNALKDYRYFKDYRDRVHGSAKIPLVGGDGDDPPINIKVTYA